MNIQNKAKDTTKNEPKSGTKNRMNKRTNDRVTIRTKITLITLVALVTSVVSCTLLFAPINIITFISKPAVIPALIFAAPDDMTSGVSAGIVPDLSDEIGRVGAGTVPGASDSMIGGVSAGTVPDLSDIIDGANAGSVPDMTDMFDESDTFDIDSWLGDFDPDAYFGTFDEDFLSGPGEVSISVRNISGELIGGIIILENGFKTNAVTVENAPIITTAVPYGLRDYRIETPYSCDFVDVKITKYQAISGEEESTILTAEELSGNYVATIDISDDYYKWDIVFTVRDNGKVRFSYYRVSPNNRFYAIPFLENSEQETTENVTGDAVEDATEATVEDAVEGAMDGVTGGVTEATAEGVVEGATEATAEGAVENVTDGVTGDVTEATTEDAVEDVMEATAEGAVENVTDGVTGDVTEATTEGAVEDVMEATAEATTEAAAEATAEDVGENGIATPQQPLRFYEKRNIINTFNGASAQIAIMVDIPLIKGVRSIRLISSSVTNSINSELNNSELNNNEFGTNGDVLHWDIMPGTDEYSLPDWTFTSGIKRLSSDTTVIPNPDGERTGGFFFVVAIGSAFEGATYKVEKIELTLVNGSIIVYEDPENASVTLHIVDLPNLQ